MTKKGNDKARRKRKEELSVFDSEIATPTDYGDFLRIDAPIQVRQTINALIPEIKPMSGGGLTSAKETTDVQQIEVPKQELKPSNDCHTALITVESISTVATPLPLTFSAFPPNLEKTSREVREKLEITQTKGGENTFLIPETAKKLSEKLENLEQLTALDTAITQPRENLEKTSREVRDNLGKGADEPSEKLEKTDTELFETSRKLRAKVRDEPRENLENSQGELREKTRLSNIIGLQRKIVLFLYEETKTVRDRSTDEIRILDLATICETSVMSTQNAIKELIKGGSLRRIEFKNGRGGWTRYEIADALYQDLVLIESRGQLREKLEKSWRKPGDKLRDKLREEVSSSSSSSKEIDLLKTTTSDDSELSREWAELDIEPLADVGFTLTHVRQVASRAKLAPTHLQESIYAFAFDLRRNEKKKSIKGDPLTYFMGIVGRGKAYAPPSNYESPEDEALRKILETKRAAAQRRAKMEDEIRNFEFEEWKSSLNIEDRQRISNGEKEGSLLQRARLSNFFEANVWPERAQELLGFDKISREDVKKQIDESLGSATPVA